MEYILTIVFLLLIVWLISEFHVVRIQSLLSISRGRSVPNQQKNPNSTADGQQPTHSGINVADLEGLRVVRGGGLVLR